MFKNDINEDGSFKPQFYDKSYYENGPRSGKGWLHDYHWMPRRTLKEAFAFVDTLSLDESSYVLDFGCAKGFIVKALRILEIKADGCDISDYALQYAPEGCWNCSFNDAWEWRKKDGYTHIICKDVLEHLTPIQLKETLIKLSWLAPKFMVVVPMGDNGVYRIPEYHTEVSHLIIEDERWWANAFNEAGWKVVRHIPHVAGLKDNWTYVPNGNCVFVMEKK